MVSSSEGEEEVGGEFLGSSSGAGGEVGGAAVTRGEPGNEKMESLA